MALIKCPNCGQDISDKAEKCPHCGWKKKREKKNKEGKFKMPSNQYVVFGGIVVLAMFVCIIVCVGITNSSYKKYEKLLKSVTSELDENKVGTTVIENNDNQSMNIIEAETGSVMEEETSGEKIENSYNTLDENLEQVSNPNFTYEGEPVGTIDDASKDYLQNIVFTYVGQKNSSGWIHLFFRITNNSTNDVNINYYRSIYVNNNLVSMDFCESYSKNIPSGKSNVLDAVYKKAEFELSAGNKINSIEMNWYDEDNDRDINVTFENLNVSIE